MVTIQKYQLIPLTRVGASTTPPKLSGPSSSRSSRGSSALHTCEQEVLDFPGELTLRTRRALDGDEQMVLLHKFVHFWKFTYLVLLLLLLLSMHNGHTWLCTIRK